MYRVDTSAVQPLEPAEFDGVISKLIWDQRDMRFEISIEEHFIKDGGRLSRH